MAAQDREQELFKEVLSFKHDPLGYVMFAFPWGVKGTPLERFDGPRAWQVREFQKIKDRMERNRFLRSIGMSTEVIYVAISSGRGPGKSAFLAMLDMWFMSCWIGGTNIVTANTEAQLRTRTMAELGKWHTMSINRHWFEKSSMSLKPNKWFKELIEDQLQMDTQYYYTDAQNWSEENPDAFAGAHSQIGMMVQFDEASGVPDPIWPVTEGFFTDDSEFRLWVVISNPRRNTGQFFECFHKDKSRWTGTYLDSREVEGIDKSVYQRIADKYGEDHDVTRVEVKGQFPRTGTSQFIGRDVVIDAQQRELVPDNGAPLIMGIDVARYGMDESVIRFRQGRDARSIPPKRYKGMNTMQLSTEAANLIDQFNPDAVLVDGGGVGGGVVDRLQFLGYRVIEVQFGERAADPERYSNRRAEIWGRMRDWLVTGCIDNSADLLDDLTGPEYEINQKGQVKLETKDAMKKRGLRSPDDGDSLAITFGANVSRRDRPTARRSMMLAQTAVNDYDEFA